MLSHTIRLNDRTARRPKLTEDEARELAARGFRFSIFSPESQEFNLSLPLQIAEDRVHQTLTIMQGDG